MLLSVLIFNLSFKEVLCKTEYMSYLILDSFSKYFMDLCSFILNYINLRSIAYVFPLSLLIFLSLYH